MRHLAKLLLVALALLVVMSPGTVPAQQNLVVQAATEPPGLDLTATPASATAGIVFYNVQEALVKVDRHGKLVPWLADKWHTSDNKNYTFFLKKGVRFQNGREMKAADVKFVFDRAMNPETKHPAVKQYEVIADIIVKDDYTLTFALKTTNANLRGRRHAQERAHRYRTLQGRRVGPRRSDRAREEHRLSREGAAEARPGHLPVHPGSERRARRAQGG